MTARSVFSFLVAVGSACAAADTALEERIARAVSQGEGARIEMVQIAPFDWDRFFVFTPYTPYEDIHRRLGFRWPAARGTGIHQHDGFTLLVFTRGSKVIAHVKMPRRDGDFSEIASDEGFSRESAVFVVRREHRGEPWLVLREAAEPEA